MHIEVCEFCFKVPVINETVEEGDERNKQTWMSLFIHVLALWLGRGGLALLTLYFALECSIKEAAL